MSKQILLEKAQKLFGSGTSLEIDGAGNRCIKMTTECDGREFEKTLGFGATWADAWDDATSDLERD